MPHAKIWHFPRHFNTDEKAQLEEAIVTAISTAFGCDRDVVSIDLVETEPTRWTDDVFDPEIGANWNRLLRTPNYEPSRP